MSTTIGSLAVGSSVYLNVDGTRTEFLVVHQGIPDASLYDASCDGTWLLMKDCYERRQWHSSDNNDYANSTIHSYLNGDFLNLFDADIKAQIKQVKIPYRAGGGSSGSNKTGANGLSCKIFLLSGYELGWTTSDNQYFPVDGAKLDYFESGTGTSANNKRIAYLSGSATYWWLRSPYTSGTGYVWSVYTSDYGSNASRSYSIRPALILSADSEVLSDGSVIVPPLQQCRVPRKNKRPETVTVTLSGTFNSTYCYVTINGMVYAAAQELKVAVGDEISIYFQGKDGTNSTSLVSRVYLNGKSVSNSVAASGGKTYSFTVTSDVKIESAKTTESSGFYWQVKITMPYAG